LSFAVELDLELDSNNSTQASEQITTGQYIYRSIATNPQPNLTTFMNILNYKLSSTNELLTSRIGLITLAHTIQVFTQSFKIGGDRAINILSTGDLFRGLGAVIAV
jgi:hypothetical protein